MILNIVIALLIAEIMSIIFWFVPYYQNGLTIYNRRLKKYESYREFEKDESITIEQVSGIFLKEISQTKILFWELPMVFYILTYAPVMRGVITFNPNSNSLEVQGKLNVSVVLFLLYVAHALDNGPNPYIPWGVPLLIFSVSYITQYARFTSYAKHIEKCLTKPSGRRAKDARR